MRPAGTRELKGLPEPLAVCEVEWARVRESLGMPLPPGFVVDREIVGRDAELALAARDLARCDGQGTAATVLVGGEPGIGKTRLAAATAAAAHADGAMVLVGRCDEDLAVPFRPWIEALRYVVARQSTRRRFATGPACAHASSCGSCPSSPSASAVWSRPRPAIPESERFALFEAVTALLVGAAAAKPLLDGARRSALVRHRKPAALAPSDAQHRRHAA